jgi:Transmembrane amino acid transporter protein
MLRYYIHVNVYVIFVILCAFGTLGYLRYGPGVHQLLVQEIRQHTVTSLLVDATLIVSVVFTYPLQCYPVIETMESYLLTSGMNNVSIIKFSWFTWYISLFSLSSVDSLSLRITVIRLYARFNKLM